MSKTILALGIALSCVSSVAFAQENRFEPRTYGSMEVTGAVYSEGARAIMQDQVVNEPVSQDTNIVIYPVDQKAAATGAIVKTETPQSMTAQSQNVVRAQYIKPGDVSQSEYQALLDEADRIRAYQTSTGKFTGVSRPVQQSQSAPVSTSDGDYEIELYAPASQAATPMPAATQVISTPATAVSNMATHRVQKGDTLYNISKRYNMSVDALKSTNGLTGNNIKLGQILTLSQMTRTIDAGTQMPVTTTLVRNVEPVPSSSDVYAVLPKDTLYAISRRSCVSVADIIGANILVDPNALKPGQRLNMPAGHCLK